MQFHKIPLALLDLGTATCGSKLSQKAIPFIGDNMGVSVNTKDIRWWFWFTTLVFIVAAVAGWIPGYYIAMGISAVQLFFFLAQEKSISSFPVQIRIVYLAVTFFALWSEVRWYIFIILLLGTVMVTFFGRCSIALVLKYMPWNHGREVRLN